MAKHDKGFCECGCGQRTTLIKYDRKKYGYVKGEYRRFVQGHHLKGGKDNLNWNGGRYKNSAGYVYIYKPNHPNATKSGYVREHVLIVEKVLGRMFPSEAEIHHVDGNPSNNNKNNLVVCQSHKYHFLLHRRKRALIASGDPNKRKCQFCNKWEPTWDALRLACSRISKLSLHKDGRHAWHPVCISAHQKKYRAKHQNRREQNA